HMRRDEDITADLGPVTVVVRLQCFCTEAVATHCYHRNEAPAAIRKSSKTVRAMPRTRRIDGLSVVTRYLQYQQRSAMTISTSRPNHGAYRPDLRGHRPAVYRRRNKAWLFTRKRQWCCSPP